LLIRTRQDEKIVGGTGLSSDGVEAGTVMTGYVFAADVWGKGYATEVCTAMVDHARGLGFRHVVAFCHPAHRASWRVLEKCGFVHDPRWTGPMAFPNLCPGVLQRVLRYDRAVDGAGRDFS
jgi:RimJ/RimL family protein N-acetyltransferase